MKTVNNNLRLVAAALLAVVLGTYLQNAGGAEAAEVENISRINGRVEVSSDEHVGDISLVNGSISLARGATAGVLETVNGSITVDGNSEFYAAETVNGSIRIADRVRASGSVSTVNGSVTLGDDVEVDGSVTTVNGRIRAGGGSGIAGSVTTVNGQILLTNTTVNRDLATDNGDISLTNGTIVRGDVSIEGRKRWWNRLFSFGIGNDPELHIDSSSVVEGDIHLYRAVDLRIEAGARTGDIIEHF
ncbi:MAG: hypothetical protein WDZ76_00060 [Pseudohongiellaceae bacterium]